MAHSDRVDAHLQVCDLDVWSHSEYSLLNWTRLSTLRR